LALAQLEVPQAHKPQRQTAPGSYSKNSLSVKLSFKLLGVRLANERWANLKLRLTTRRSGKRSFNKIQDMLFDCRKVRKHSTGKQPPEVA
jgi:hypothetical protein